MYNPTGPHQYLSDLDKLQNLEYPPGLHGKATGTGFPNLLFIFICQYVNVHITKPAYQKCCCKQIRSTKAVFVQVRT